jgi:dolichol-phosphate mannosyltransferase
MSDPVLSVVLPCYREALNVPLLVPRLRALCEGLPVASEVIFVDDHSDDNTWACLAQACEGEASWRAVRLASNGGSHAAVLAGLGEARGLCAVFLASDLQDPPELIPKMLRLWAEGHHVVWATRARREGVSWGDRAGSAVYHGLVQALSPFEPPPSGSDFALVDRRVIEALLASPGARPNILTEIARMGLRRAEVPYVKEARRLGRSGWTFGKKVALLLDTLISFSHAPLRLMSYIGLGSSGLGFFYAVWIVADYVRLGNPVQGWSSLMIAVLVLGGVQLTMLGVLGEYLWRALGEARRRPPYLVQERSDDALDPRVARARSLLVGPEP